METSILSQNPITVQSAASGDVRGRLTLTRNRKTLIFKPDSAFKAGDTIHVSLAAGLKNALGQDIPAQTFSFRITPTRNAAPPMTSEELILSDVPKSASVSNDAMPRAAIADVPPDFPEITVDSRKPTAPGNIFLSNLSFPARGNTSPPYLMILNNFSEPIFYRQMPANCFDFKLQPTNTLTYFDGSQGYFIEMDTAYNVINDIRCGNGYPTDLHELIITKDRRTFLMSYDAKFVDMSQIIQGGNPNARVIGLVVQELDEDKNVVFEWRSWDHIDITDATRDINLFADVVDYVHGNSIELDNDGNLLVSCRHLDEVLKISRETGEVMWRLGGRASKKNQFRFLNDTLAGFSHQHSARRLANGNVLIFDNGNLHTPSISRAVEYRLDETTKTATLVWQYLDSARFFAAAMGSVQRLPNGNTLIGWGSTTPTLTEVSPSGEKLFELSFPTGVFSYRAFRFGDVNLLSTPNDAPKNLQGYALGQNYPNPFNPTTVINYQLPVSGNVSLKIYDMLGRNVATLINQRQEAGRYAVQFNGVGLASGVYFYRLDAGAFSETKKMMLVK